MGRVPLSTAFSFYEDPSMHPSQYNVKKRMLICCFLERFPYIFYVRTMIDILDGNPKKTNILLPISYQIISIYAPRKAH